MDYYNPSGKTKLVKRILESDLNNGRKIESKCQSFLNRRLNPCDIEDVMQNSYLKAVQFAELYDEKRPFLPWFMGIVKNSYFDFLRKDRKRKEISMPALFEGHYQADNGEYSIETICLDNESNPESIYSDNEMVNLVRSMTFQNLILLESNYSSVLIRYYYLGQKYDEIAVLEGIPIGTVRTRLRRAKNIFRKLIENHLEPELTKT